MTPPSSLNWFDIALIALAVVGGLRGLQLGLSGQIARLIGLGMTILVALLLRERATLWLAMHTRIPPEATPGVALGGLLAGGLLLTAVIRRLLRPLITVTVTPAIERGGGFIGGVLRTALVLVLLVLALHFIPSPDVRWHTLERSVLGRWIALQVPLGYERLVTRHPDLRKWLERIPVPIDAILQTNQTLVAGSPAAVGAATNETATVTNATGAATGPAETAEPIPAPAAEPEVAEEPAP